MTVGRFGEKSYEWQEARNYDCPVFIYNDRSPRHMSSSRQRTERTCYEAKHLETHNTQTGQGGGRELRVISWSPEHCDKTNRRPGTVTGLAVGHSVSVTD